VKREFGCKRKFYEVVKTISGRIIKEKMNESPENKKSEEFDKEMEILTMIESDALIHLLWTCLRDPTISTSTFSHPTTKLPTIFTNIPQNCNHFH